MLTLSTESLRSAFASGTAGPTGRPLSQLSFALNHYFSRFDPFAFKATNLAIHLLTGCLALLLAARLLAKPRLGLSEHQLRVSAGIVAAAWLLHPIQLLPVLHVVQRMTSLSAMFMFAAMLLHVRAREREGTIGWWSLAAAWGILWPLSLLAKETGVLFPVFALMYELILRRAPDGTLDGFTRMVAGTVGLAGAGASIYALSPYGQWLWAGYEMRPFTLCERLMTEPRVLWHYLGLIFLPRFEAFSLYHDDIVLFRSMLDPWTTLPAMIGTCFWSRWRGMRAVGRPYCRSASHGFWLVTPSNQQSFHWSLHMSTGTTCPCSACCYPLRGAFRC